MFTTMEDCLARKKQLSATLQISLIERPRSFAGCSNPKFCATFLDGGLDCFCNACFTSEMGQSHRFYDVCNMPVQRVFCGQAFQWQVYEFTP
jgi:hypothetical protein